MICCDLAASRAETSAREAKARLRRSRKRVDAEVFEYQEIARHFRVLATELRTNPETLILNREEIPK
jgi:hypothetical protein